jgi:hypothetical protein
MSKSNTFKSLYWEEKVQIIKDCKSLTQRLQTCSPWGSFMPSLLMTGLNITHKNQVGNFDEGTL